MKQINWRAFSKSFREARAKAGLSVRELATDLNVGHSTICRAENGFEVSANYFMLFCLYIKKPPQMFYVEPKIRRREWIMKDTKP
jgi:transcriptional regulator with XRE-family HTH domain